MSKHRQQQNRVHQLKHAGVSMSVGPETMHQVQDQISEVSSRSEFGFVPSYEDIQIRAYQIHLEKGGSDLENWLEAEQTLKEEHQMQQ